MTRAMCLISSSGCSRVTLMSRSFMDLTRFQSVLEVLEEDRFFMSSSLIRLHPGRLKHPVPARHLGADVGGGLDRPGADRLGARSREALQHGLVLQRLLRGVVHALDHALRR